MGQRFVTPDARIEAYTAHTADGCIVYTGNALPSGYAQITVKRRKVYVHRYVWERDMGPIPPGFVVDHMCHTKNCIRLDHLRVTTPKINGEHRRGVNANNTSGRRGVTRTTNGRWRAYVRHNNRQWHAGTFPTIEAASEAAEALRRQLFAAQPKIRRTR